MATDPCDRVRSQSPEVLLCRSISILARMEPFERLTLVRVPRLRPIVNRNEQFKTEAITQENRLLKGDAVTDDPGRDKANTIIIATLALRPAPQEQ